MSNGVRRSFTKEFKMEAVKLATTPTADISETARNLGIHNSILRRWIKASEEGGSAFRGHGRLKPQDDEMRSLRKELDRTRQERDILKKAVAFFARELR